MHEEDLPLERAWNREGRGGESRTVGTGRAAPRKNCMQLSVGVKGCKGVKAGKGFLCQESAKGNGGQGRAS